MISISRFICLTMVLVAFTFNAQADEDDKASSTAWLTKKTEWTGQDELKFGEFLAQLGETVERRECETVDSCLKGSGNPYRYSDPASLNHYADCSDFPYHLRAYFAWKNGLPFSMVSGITARVKGPEEPGTDLRYTRFGNKVTDRYDVLSKSKWGRVSHPSALSVFEEVQSEGYSANYRMQGFEDGKLFTDFYPVVMNRNAIRPGTVVYDPNGHIAIIYKVTEDGRIFYIDAHPDNTLTSGMFTPKFSRSTPEQGAGFKNFRPIRLVGAKRDSSGNYYGGKIEAVKNAQLPYFSSEQFYGNQPDPGGDWKKGKFVIGGRALSFNDYLRIRMAKEGFRINPIKDVRDLVNDICTSAKDRVVAIDASSRSGVQNKNHPERLPANIYGTDGEWELYATSARDARLKVAFMDLLAESKQFVERFRAGDPVIDYNGTNLARDMLATYTSEAKACQFSYRNTAGRSVTLDIEDLRLRLFDISFDPYHCVEYRWGAKDPQELASCRDNDNKKAWYSQERWLRYQWERRYDAKMDYSLAELTGPLPGAGIANPPDVDIVKYLSSEKSE
ncbi:hypothetical protein D3C72_610290 [compost metagenome]